MKIIVFYISDHGFGHASRNIPIIRYILEVFNDTKVIVKTGQAQGEFIRSILKWNDSRLETYCEPMDIGLVLKENSLEIDKCKLQEKVEGYVNSFEEKILKEKTFLQKNNVDVVISDIVPWIFKATKALSIPSILITNFTWVEIYKEHIKKELCDIYEDCYRLADKALFYELYMNELKRYIKNYEEISLCSRGFNLIKVEEIKKKFNNPIVLLSVGRSVNLTNEMDVSKLKYDFIATEGINLIGDNVHYLSREVENTQDYIMASDYVITKAGWGTVAEVLLSKKKCAVLSRENVAEDRSTISKLKNMELALEVSYEEDFNIENILIELENTKFKHEKYSFRNDYEYIGKKILRYIRKDSHKGEI